MNEQYFTSLNGYIVKDPKAFRYYDNVNSMKTDTSLKEGMYVKTKGYTNAYDGGNAEYIIVNDDSLSDNGSIHILTNGLRAKLICDNNVNVEVFGAIGDGEADDTTALTNAITYCSNNGKTLSSNGGTYLITSDLTIHNCPISFNYGKIKSAEKVLTLTANDHAWDYNGDRFIIVEKIKFEDTNVICNSPAIFLQYLEFIDWHNIALEINSARAVDNIIYSNDRSDANTVSIKINSPDKIITKLHGKGGFTGIVINAMNVCISDSQLWLSDKNRVDGSLDGSKFIRVLTGSGIMIDNCISDTYQYALYFDQTLIRGTINNFQVINNNVLYKNCDMYFINKQEQLIGNAIFRLTNFASDNINFHITHPCMLDLIWFDGNPVDKTIYTNINEINGLIQNYDGTAYDTTNITHNSAPYIAINKGNLQINLDISFTTPNIQQFYINTSAIAGMKQIRGYAYITCVNNDGTNDSYVTGYVSRSSNDKILISSSTGGNIKKAIINILFAIH